MQHITKVVRVLPNGHAERSEYLVNGVRAALTAKGVGWETTTEMPDSADSAVYLVHVGTMIKSTEGYEELLGKLTAEVRQRVILTALHRSGIYRLKEHWSYAGGIAICTDLTGRVDLFEAVIPGETPIPFRKRDAEGRDVPSRYTGYHCDGLHKTLPELVAAYIEALDGKLGS